MAWNVEDTDYVLKQISFGGYDAEKNIYDYYQDQGYGMWQYDEEGNPLEQEYLLSGSFVQYDEEQGSFYYTEELGSKGKDLEAIWATDDNTIAKKYLNTLFKQWHNIDTFWSKAYSSGTLYNEYGNAADSLAYGFGMGPQGHHTFLSSGVGGAERKRFYEDDTAFSADMDGDGAADFGFIGEKDIDKVDLGILKERYMNENMSEMRKRQLSQLDDKALKEELYDYYRRDADLWRIPGPWDAPILKKWLETNNPNALESSNFFKQRK